MSELSIEITSRELARLVNPVIPLTDKSGYYPLLGAIKIESRGKYLLASATDRFRAGMQRIVPEIAPSEGVDFLIGLAELKRIQTIFKGTRHSVPTLRLTVVEAGLLVESVGGFEGFSSASMTFTLQTGDFPKVHRLFTTQGKASADAVTTQALNAKFLADFQHAVTDASPAVVRFAESNKPVIITVGGDFIGLLMPTRRGEPTDAKDPELDEWLELLADDGKPADTKAA